MYVYNIKKYTSITYKKGEITHVESVQVIQPRFSSKVGMLFNGFRCKRFFNRALRALKNVFGKKKNTRLQWKPYGLSEKNRHKHRNVLCNGLHRDSVCCPCERIRVNKTVIRRSRSRRDSDLLPFERAREIGERSLGNVFSPCPARCSDAFRRDRWRSGFFNKTRGRDGKRRRNARAVESIRTTTNGRTFAEREVAFPSAALVWTSHPIAY